MVYVVKMLVTVILISNIVGLVFVGLLSIFFCINSENMVIFIYINLDIRLYRIHTFPSPQSQ